MADDQRFAVRWLHRLTPLLGVSLFLFALWLLHRELRNYKYADLVRVTREIPHARLWAGVAMTAISYAVLTFYDALGVRYVRRRLSYGRIAMASLVGYGVSMTLGFPLLTGAPLRYRMYTRWGLTPGEIARIIAFYSTTFWLGVLAVGGAALLFDPPHLPPELNLDARWLPPMGALLLVLMVAYFLLAAFNARIEIRGFRVEMPSLGMAIAQVLSSSLDWVIAAAVLYVLLPEHAPSFGAFFTIYVVGQTIGHASHVPGGLGVFESIVLFFLSPRVPAPEVLAALLAWRAIYYLLPLAGAVVTLAAHELRRLYAGGVPEPLAEWFSALAPQLLAVASFVSGAVLLFSVATPVERERMAWLNASLPLAVMEAAHLATSAIGIGLLLVSRGLQMRLAAAWRLASILLAAGMVTVLLKGIDYEEAAVLAVALGALLASRSRFYRRAALRDEPFTPGWIVAAGVVLAVTAWIGFFAYKHVDYAPELWLRFAPLADASRFLRASVAAGVVLAAAGVAQLLHRRPEPHLPLPGELDEVRRIVAESPRADANLALLGDKTLLFNPARTAFLMYGVSGRSWVALGDPVGPDAERDELAWRFREEADRHGAFPVFYHVPEASLPRYLDMGLTPLKLGEEAVVPLDDFSLDDEPRAGLRRSWERARARGATAEIVAPDAVPPPVDELRALSDDWLARRGARERAFSSARFDPAALAAFPLAIVRREGRIVAFATVWTAAPGTEVTVDGVRYARGAPASVMEYLLVEVMRWAKGEGYRALNLGMAPMSGLQSRDLASRWNRVGGLAFRHGEHFQNLKGLRHYKERFGGEWRTQYLAAPGGPALPRILADLAALLSGDAGRSSA